VSALRVQIPESLRKQLRVLAKRDKITVDQFISTAVAEKMSALMAESYLIDRAKRGSRAAYDRVLAKVPDVEPEARDRLDN
jgi:hypothetical protein